MGQGTQLAWLVDPEDESVMVFNPPHFPEIKSEEEILPVLDSFQELELSAEEIFDWLSIG